MSGEKVLKEHPFSLRLMPRKPTLNQKEGILNVLYH